MYQLLTKLFIVQSILLIASCASAPHDYKEALPAEGLARIYVYRPHVTQMMLAEYEISVAGKAAKILKDGSYLSWDVVPGKTEVRSRHRDEKEGVALPLDIIAGKIYFVKLDPDVEDLTVAGFLGNVLAIGNMVNGEKARIRIENGQGSLHDVGKFIQGERAKGTLQAKHPLGYHLLLAMEEQAGRREIQSCCSSLPP